MPNQTNPLTGEPSFGPQYGDQVRCPLRELDDALSDTPAVPAVPQRRPLLASGTAFLAVHLPGRDGPPWSEVAGRHVEGPRRDRDRYLRGNRRGVEERGTGLDVGTMGASAVSCCSAAERRLTFGRSASRHRSTPVIPTSTRRTSTLRSTPTSARPTRTSVARESFRKISASWNFDAHAWPLSQNTTSHFGPLHDGLELLYVHSRIGPGWRLC